MAGFAVSLKLVLANPEACFDGEAPMGLLESSFLQGLVTMDELEPKADNCTKVRVCALRDKNEDLSIIILEQMIHCEMLCSEVFSLFSL